MGAGRNVKTPMTSAGLGAPKLVKHIIAEKNVKAITVLFNAMAISVDKVVKALVAVLIPVKVIIVADIAQELNAQCSAMVCTVEVIVTAIDAQIFVRGHTVVAIARALVVQMFARVNTVVAIVMALNAQMVAGQNFVVLFAKVNRVPKNVPKPGAVKIAPDHTAR